MGAMVDDSGAVAVLVAVLVAAVGVALAAGTLSFVGRFCASLFRQRRQERRERADSRVIATVNGADVTVGVVRAALEVAGLPERGVRVQYHAGRDGTKFAWHVSFQAARRYHAGRGVTLHDAIADLKQCEADMTALVI